MSNLPDRAHADAESAVAEALQGYLGYQLNAESCGEVVGAVVEALAGEGLILVRRDDLDAYLGQGTDIARWSEALTRLRAALSEKNEDTR